MVEGRGEKCDRKRDWNLEKPHAIDFRSGERKKERERGKKGRKLEFLRIF